MDGHRCRAAMWILSAIATVGTAAWGFEGADDLEIDLTVPMERHVFQRRGTSGPIVIQGAVPGGADRVDVQVLRAGMVVLPWHPIAMATEQFQAVETMPQGGWYAVQVRAVRGNTVAMVAVNRVGIGEVFLTAGQSNSANSGAFHFTAMDTVSAWTGTGWVVANDPQPIADGNRGSTWAVMGNDLTVELGRADGSPLPIGLISVGFARTQVRNWLPDAQPFLPRYPQPLFGRMRQPVQTFAPWGGFRAVLWDQGESDSHHDTSADAYCRDLTTIIRTMRSLGNPSNPVPWWIIAHATSIWDPPLRIDQVLEGQTLAIQYNPPAFHGPDTNVLVPERDRQKDHIHFDRRGQEIVGHAWARSVLNALQEAGDPSAITAAILGANAPLDPALPSSLAPPSRRPAAGRDGARPGVHGANRASGAGKAGLGHSHGGRPAWNASGSQPTASFNPNPATGGGSSGRGGHKHGGHHKR